MTNLDKYIAVRSLIGEAITILESVEVGINKARYKSIERIINTLENASYATVVELTEIEEHDRPEAK